MKYYSISNVADELGIHESSLRRWEEWEYIFPERVGMGKTSIRIYSRDDLDILRRAKRFIDQGIELSEAFDKAYSDFMKEGDRQE